MYASFSLEILSLSNNGLKIVPTVTADIFDSTNNKKPVNEAYNWTLFLFYLFFADSFFWKLFINPSTPPVTWISVINEPTKKVKKTTLVFPGSLKTLTILSIVNRIPWIGFQFPMINPPKKIPVNKEIKTCFVLIARMIAIIGGIKERKP